MLAAFLAHLQGLVRIVTFEQLVEPPIFPPKDFVLSSIRAAFIKRVKSRLNVIRMKHVHIIGAWGGNLLTRQLVLVYCTTISAVFLPLAEIVVGDVFELSATAMPQQTATCLAVRTALSTATSPRAVAMPQESATCFTISAAIVAAAKPGRLDAE